MVKWVNEGEAIPAGYAISYRDFACLRSAAYPIPLHFLVRWWRDMVCWIMVVGLPSYRDDFERRIYRKAWDAVIERHRIAWDKSRELEYARGFAAGIVQEQQDALVRFDVWMAERRATR